MTLCRAPTGNHWGDLNRRPLGPPPPTSQIHCGSGRAQSSPGRWHLVSPQARGSSSAGLSLAACISLLSKLHCSLALTPLGGSVAPQGHQELWPFQNHESRVPRTSGCVCDRVRRIRKSRPQCPSANGNQSVIPTLTRDQIQQMSEPAGSPDHQPCPSSF